MKSLQLLALVLFVVLSANSQTNAEAIRGKMPLAPGSEVRLYSIKLHRSELVATVRTEKDSIFKMPLPANSYHGFYLLRWSGGETELLYDGSLVSVSIAANGQPTVVRGEQWELYRQNRALLLELRNTQLQLDSLLQASSADAFGYKKINRKIKRNQRQLNKLRKKFEKAGESLWSRTLLFEFNWLGYSPEAFAKWFSAEEALQLVTLTDTLALHHNRWPNFMLQFVAAYAPSKLANTDSALLQCSRLLIEKAKKHPAYLEGSLQFLQMGMQAFDAKAATQFLQREKNLFGLCFDPDQANKQSLYANKLLAGASLPAIENLPVKGPSVLVFWSAECMPCLEELTDLHLWLKNNRPEMQVLALALNADETGWMAEKQAFDSWTHERLSAGWDSQITAKLGINRVPFYCVIDAAGKITAIYEQTAPFRRALER